MNGIIQQAPVTCLLFLALTAHPLIAQDCLHLSGCDTCQCDSLSCDSAAPGCDCVGCDGGQCSCQHQSCSTRATLTGDWCGLRSHLRESGITFRGTSTHYGFGIDGGINTPVPSPLQQGNAFEYTGRERYDVIFDLEKFGGMPKGTLLVRGESWYGEYGNVGLRSGSFTPPLFPTVLPTDPTDEGVPKMTAFMLTQPLSPGLIVFAGKKDILGAADQDIFAGGNGTEQFMNQAFIANPAFLLAFPYTSFTAGAVMPRPWGGMSFYIYDPKDRTRDFFKLNDLFSDGIIVGGEVKRKTNFFNKPGEHHVGGVWKHLDLPDLAFNEPPPGDYPYPQIPGVPTKSDSYTLYYGFDQFIRVFSRKEQRGWGMFARGAITDGNPNPVKYFLSAGLGGDSALRRGDRFGLGWYYVGVSNELGPVPQALFGPRDGSGVEMFYNYKVTPWLNITPDVQYIHPGAGGIADDAFIGGVRLNMKM
jgi:porin